jgi:ribonuclease HII
VVEFYSTEIEILNSIPNASIIKGDSKLWVLLLLLYWQTYRDEYMNTIHEESPCTIETE